MNTPDPQGTAAPTTHAAKPARLFFLRRFVNWLEYWWHEAWSDERHAIQIIVALACLLVSAAIGYAYANEIFVSGWQLWVWLMCCVIIVTLLIPSRRPKITADRTLLLLIAAALAGLLLRAVFLETIPGGLHTDEAGTAGFTMEHVYSRTDHTLNPFIVSSGSHPTLYHYTIKLFMTVFGCTIAGVRSSSVFAGTLAILATFAVVAVFQNRRVALIAAILTATYHYHIHWSRLALNNIWDTLWIPLALAAFAWGWENRWSGGAVIAGVALGLGEYFYQGGRIGVILMVFVVLGLWWKERDGHRVMIHVGKMTLIALCIAAPLLVYAVRNPGPFLERFHTVYGWQPEVIQEITGSPTDYFGFAWYQLWRSFGAYTAVPDITGFYGPEVPLTFGLAAPLLIIGFFWAIYKKQYLPSLWLFIVTMLGGFMLSGAPSSSHYVASMPAIVWLVAISLEWLIEHRHSRFAIALLVIIVATDLIFYFGIYVPGHPRDLIHAFPVIPPPTS